ncbi:mitochondrial ribosomal protein L37-domain-containing protein [Crepidotus variabilis]|uniref:Large ribosomal subunit protein mL54 n=1 Tax=Crepidotus variabilis TaxID=179855 RepID=A0A9P6EPC6_9AGAR|nr:mitochondrial ribosomal protein L37-domain-containing protein [Crepidotus variabilis]
MSLQAVFRTSVASSSRFQCVYRRYASAAATSSAEKDGKKAKASDSAAAATSLRSSCVQDTVLTGVNYLKGQPPLVAKPDEEYPEWLWSTLKPKVHEDDAPGGKKERVERRNANRQAIKDRNFMSTQ